MMIRKKVSIWQKLMKLYKKYRMSETEYAEKVIGVKMGKGCRLFDCTYGSEPFLIEMGDRVLAHKTTFTTHDGSAYFMVDEKGRRYVYKRIKIGNDVMIGSNSTIMPGVEIEDDCIIAGGSVVIKSIPKGSIVGGNPAKIIGNYYDYKEKALRDFYAEADISKEATTFEECVLSIVDENMKPFMK